MKEIRFEGSELQVCIKNLRDTKESLPRFLKQSRIALSEQPKSQFWKDAVAFMEAKKL